MSTHRANPADPWSIDYFNPPTPDIKAPEPHAVPSKPKTSPPGIDRLFSIQDDLVRAVNALEDPKARKELERNVQNAYRLINRYLREYS